MRAACLPLLAVALLAALLAAPASSLAAPGTGTVSLKLGAKALKAQGVKTAAGRPATLRRGRLTLPVSRVAVGSRAVVKLGGELRFRRGGRRVRFRALGLTLGSRSGAVTAKVGKRRIKVLVASFARGRKRMDGSADTVALTGAKLRLTKAAARALRRGLRLRRRAALRLGPLRADAKPRGSSGSRPGPGGGSGGGGNGGGGGGEGPSDDPYASACPIARSGLFPTDPPGSPATPAPLPTFASPTAITGASSADWGFKQSFLSYMASSPGYPAAGTPAVGARDGATYAAGSFRFPASGGRLDEGLTPGLPADDRLVLEGRGTALFCHTAHFFWISLSSPTVVIDGPSSRIVLTVGTNQRGTYYGSKRADFATLNLAAVTPVASDGGKTITWANVPATLTEDGSKVFGGMYDPGEALDPITVTARIP